MIVSDQARLLFVHVQKTGGVSTERHLMAALDDAKPVRVVSRHATYADILAVRPEYADYWSFAFVRNPWSRLWSWWRMIHRMKVKVESGKENASRKVAANGFWADVVESIDSFEQFVLDGPDRHERLRRPQVDYLSAPGREVDFVGRTESFEDDLARVFVERGLPPFEKVERHNSGSATADYHGHFTDAMRARVEEVFAPDIERFGYTY
jgi:hypothetical protein